MDNSPGPEDDSTNQAFLVRLDRISMRFGENTIFSGLSLCLLRGERLVLLGANGAGKSTLLRLIQGELRPVQNADVFGDHAAPGRIFWNFQGKEEPFALTALTHARLVSPGQQRNYARRGWNVTGEEIVLSGLDNVAMIQGELSARHYAKAAKLAEEIGAEHLMSMTAPAMSQGQLRLVLLLRALISDPALLLLDEPFDGLDADSRKHVSRCIAMAAEAGGTLIVSAHREEDIPPFVTGALLLRNGRLERTPPPLRPYPAESASLGSPLPLLPAPSLANNASNSRVTANKSSPAPVRRQGFADKSLPSISLVECSQSGPRGASFLQAAPVAELEHVNVFTNRQQILFDINWIIRPGEQWILSGGNGAGKSALLRLLYGEEFVAYGGTLRWKGCPRPSLEELRADVGYVSDRLQYAYDYDISAEDVIISGIRGTIGLYREPDEHERALARDWLKRMDLAASDGKNFHSLSSGTARRVLLARALAASPSLLLLDEPCSGLDSRSKELFLNTLPVLAEKGATIVHVTHHEQDTSSLFTHELRLDKGRVAFSGARTPFFA